MHPGSSPDPRLGPSPCLDPDLDSSLVLDLTRKQSPTPNRFLGVGPGLGVRIRTSLRTEVVGRGFPCSHRTSTGVVRPTHCRCQTAGRSVDVPAGTLWTHCRCQMAGRSVDVPGGTWWTCAAVRRRAALSMSPAVRGGHTAAVRWRAALPMSPAVRGGRMLLTVATAAHVIHRPLHNIHQDIDTRAYNLHHTAAPVAASVRHGYNVCLSVSFGVLRVQQEATSS